MSVVGLSSGLTTMSEPNSVPTSGEISSSTEVSSSGELSWKRDAMSRINIASKVIFTFAIESNTDLELFELQACTRGSVKTDLAATAISADFTKEALAGGAGRAQTIAALAVLDRKSSKCYDLDTDGPSRCWK